MIKDSDKKFDELSGDVDVVNEGDVDDDEGDAADNETGNDCRDGFGTDEVDDGDAASMSRGTAQMDDGDGERGPLETGHVK